jgi:hypothetical protein
LLQQAGQGLVDWHQSRGHGVGPGFGEAAF